MGCGSSTVNDYVSRSHTYSNCSTEQIFQKRSIRTDFDPKNITIRESRDSNEHPESTPIIVGLDNTGSMGRIATDIAKNGLVKIMKGLLQETPVSDPQIMFMSVGDMFYDRYPLQVTQFESDLKMYDQLIDLYLEGCGGGNAFESYDAPWLFAANRTRTDSYDKRGKKGYLFTIGDEGFPKAIDYDTLNSKFGYNMQGSITADEEYDLASKTYNVFHLIIEEGSFCRQHGSDYVLNDWSNHIGKHALLVSDHTKIADIVNSVILINEGAEPFKVISLLQDENTKKVVAHAIGLEYSSQE